MVERAGQSQQFGRRQIPLHQITINSGGAIRRLTLQPLADTAAAAGVRAELPPQLSNSALSASPLGAPQPLPDDDADIARPGKQAYLSFAPPQQASVTGSISPPRPAPRATGAGDRL